VAAVVFFNPPCITIIGTQLAVVNMFSYLKSVVRSSNCLVYAEHWAAHRKSLYHLSDICIENME